MTRTEGRGTYKPAHLCRMRLVVAGLPHQCYLSRAFFTSQLMTQFFLNKSRIPLALTGVGALILVFIIATSIWLAQATTERTAEVLQGRVVRIAASGLLNALVDAETNQRGYLITGHPEFLRLYEKARALTVDNMTRLQVVAKDSGPVPFKTDELRQLVDARMQVLQRLVGMARSGRRAASLSMVGTGGGRQMMGRIRLSLGEIIDRSERSVAANMVELNRNAILLRTVTAFGGVVIALFAALALWLLLRAIQVAVQARSELEKLNESLEDRVTSRTAALTRANDEIQRFAYIVSHDLRAPLVNIMGFTSELEVGTAALRTYFEREDSETKPAAQDAALNGLPEAVRFIRSSTAKMDRLITAILKLSREGRRELLADAVDLNKVFETILSSLKHQIGETGTTVELSPLLPTIRSDRVALEQIFGNLLDNALKYLQPGRPGRLSVKAETNQKFVTVRLADNGRGIAPEDQERVFELFRRAGRQDKPGEGIGLAHVRALVRRMGGDITVDSRLGEGSEFRVMLPRILAPQSSDT